MFLNIAGAMRALVVALLLSGGVAQAHEGHDHGEAPKPASTLASPRGEATSDAFELVAVARGGKLVVYLDHFQTNEPVANAKIDVETPDGSRALAPASDGSFMLDAPWSSKPGSLDLVFTVTSGSAVDILPVSIIIPEAVAALTSANAGFGSAALGEQLSRLDPMLLGIAGAAFLLGIAVSLVARGRRYVSAVAALITVVGLVLPASFARAHEGEDHNEEREAPRANAVATSDLAQRLPDGSVFVPKPTQRILALRTAVTQESEFPRTIELPGRIIADPNASGVVQSSVGGRLSAPQGGFPRLGTKVKQGTILAYVTPPVQAIDVSDMRQRQGELDQQIGIFARRVERYERLAPTGAVARTQLEEAQLELQGLKDRRAALEQIRRDPEALIAPVDGVIAETSAVAGQMAAPGAVIFQVIDPSRLWVEALSFDATAGAAKATAQLADGRTLALTYQGTGITDRNQSVPVHFAVSGDTAGLRVGQFVRVQAATTERTRGLALPRASVVRAGNGQDVIYEHVSAERFEQRPVRVAPLDGERVLISAGIPSGKRIVSQGAELLDQVR